VGIGTDLDGAYGKEQCPFDLETIADLQNLPTLFTKRGYTQIEIEKIMHGNWLRILKRSLPED
jgi:membrane dipeptidase